MYLSHHTWDTSITWNTQELASCQCVCVYTVSGLSNMEIERRWFQEMLNDQLPLPFLFKEAYIIFIGRYNWQKRLQEQRDGRKDEPAKKGVWDCMDTRAHERALHILYEFHSWKEASCNACNAAQGMPLCPMWAHRIRNHRGNVLFLPVTSTSTTKLPTTL